MVKYPCNTTILCKLSYSLCISFKGIKNEKRLKITTNSTRYALIDYIVTLYIIDKKVVTFIKEITIKKKIALMLSLIYFVYFISM